MLNFDGRKRINAQDVLNHEWFKLNLEKSDNSDKELINNI